MKVIVAGATGLIGSALAQTLRDAGHEVVALSRQAPGAGKAARLPEGVRAVQWDGATVQDTWRGEVDGAGAVVNLAGASIGGGRWTEGRKRLLRESRLRSTGALVAAIGAADPARRPGVLVSASGMDYYGHRPEHQPVTEETPAGDSFLARLCLEWEAAAEAAAAHGVRVVTMRTAVVFARDALAFRLLVLPFRLFAGGPLGSGQQWFTWIHLDDIVGLYRYAIEHPELQGPVNATAPDTRPQRDVARAVGHALHRPSWAPAPAPILRLVLGEQADVLLHGRNATPQRALEAGYTFRYPRLEPALAAELGG